jgi:hypothetical protein
MTIHVTDIDWDLTDENGDPLPEEEIKELNLPKETDVEFDDDGRDLDEQIADILSEEYDFCVNLFCFDPPDGPTEDEALEEVYNACLAGDTIGSAALGDGCVFVDINGTTFRVTVEKC